MTPTERLAVRRALVTADFSRSPGLRERMLRSLATSPEWGFITTAVLGVIVWALLIWWLGRAS